MPSAQPHSADWIDRDFVAYHAAVRPKQTACIAFQSGERLSYDAFHKRADRAAAALRALAGEVRGLAVSYLSRNSIDYLAFVVACYRTGAVLQPLNWRLSAAELEVLLLDAGPVLVVYEEEFAGPLMQALKPLPHARALSTLEFADEVAAAGSQAFGAHPFVGEDMAPDDPFVLLYTSGTTGKPKGAIISRRNIFWESFNFAAVGDVTADSVMVCDSPMFHTVGLVAAAWTTLQKGATFALSDRFMPAETLGRLLDESLGATHYFGVPQIARALIDDPAYKPRALNRLTGFFLGGAPCPHDLIERLADDGVRVANGFGMSETGTVMHVPRDLDVIRAKPGSVGLPAPAMQVRVADEQGRDRPDGEVGELLVRGPGVARGYWRRPEATEEAFIDGWFKSGDIGMRDADGFFYVLDRSKDMYISGGENVYPAEVESALLRIAGVADVAVVGVADARWGEVGCAYIVLRDGVDLDARHVIESCGQWLAPYKRPKHVRYVQAIPRNAAGKAQKAALRERPL